MERFNSLDYCDNAPNPFNLSIWTKTKDTPVFKA
jgi:hypothetical protein